MPVTAKRGSHTETVSTIESFGTLTFTGTYTPGGVALNPLSIQGGPGSSSFGSKVLAFMAISPLNYGYVLVGTGASAMLKVFTAANTELGAVAFPEATVPYVLKQSKA